MAGERAGRLTREESRRRTRELLLDAAAIVFAREGFEGASVDEVAEEAGFSKGAVYSNFGGKDDLFLALLDRQLGQTIGPNWLGVFAAGKPLGERVAGASALLDGPDAGGTLWTNLELEFYLYATRNPAFRERVAERYDQIRAGIAETLRRHFAELGLTPPLPPEELAWLFPALATGLAIQRGLAQGPPPPDLWADVLARLLGAAATPGVGAGGEGEITGG